MIFFLLLTSLAASCLGNTNYQDDVPVYWESVAPELQPVMKAAHQTLVKQAEKSTDISVCSKMNTAHTMVIRARQALDCGCSSSSDLVGHSDHKAIMEATRSCIGSEDDVLCLVKKLGSLVSTQSLGAVCSGLREVESGLKTGLVIFCHEELLGGVSSGRGEFTLYEGNDGSQNQVCTLYWDKDRTFNFKHYDACENDETRSGILRYADYGTTITLYDSPSGDKGDDYTVIKVKAAVAEEVMIRSYEQSQTIAVGDGTVEITHHHHNGLDGKVSRVEIVKF